MCLSGVSRGDDKEHKMTATLCTTHQGLVISISFLQTTSDTCAYICMCLSACVTRPCELMALSDYATVTTCKHDFLVPGTVCSSLHKKMSVVSVMFPLTVRLPRKEYLVSVHSANLNQYLPTTAHEYLANVQCTFTQ